MLIRNISTTEDNKLFGVSVFSFGEMAVYPKEHYPSRKYFKEHSDLWKSWRTLSDLFIVHILEGKGLFQIESSEVQEVSAGDTLILKPDTKHRYTPDKESGWKECWIGLRGSYISQLLEQPSFLSGKSHITPLRSVMFKKIILDIRELVLNEKVGYQSLIASQALSLLVLLHNSSKHDALVGKRIERIIQSAKHLIQQKQNLQLDMNQVAVELGVSYSWFRKNFKQYTGQSPHQYLLQLHIQSACELLMKTTMPVKQIAYQLGFESSGYFCRLFKAKVGLSPKQFRLKR